MVTRVTVEGDRIPLYLRALPGSPQVEVFSDNTRDDFGTKVWTHQTCTGAAGNWLEPSGCTEPVEYLAHPITGTWIPRQIGNDFPKSQREGAKYTVTFAGDGTWTADDTCDGTTGVYTVDATGTFSAQVTNSPPTAACDPGGVTKALTRTERVVITSDRLRLLDSTSGADADILGDFVPD